MLCEPLNKISIARENQLNKKTSEMGLSLMVQTICLSWFKNREWLVMRKSKA